MNTDGQTRVFVLTIDTTDKELTPKLIQDAVWQNLEGRVTMNVTEVEGTMTTPYDQLNDILDRVCEESNENLDTALRTSPVPTDPREEVRALLAAAFNQNNAASTPILDTMPLGAEQSIKNCYNTPTDHVEEVVDQIIDVLASHIEQVHYKDNKSAESLITDIGTLITTVQREERERIKNDLLSGAGIGTSVDDLVREIEALSNPNQPV